MKSRCCFCNKRSDCEDLRFAIAHDLYGSYRSYHEECFASAILQARPGTGASQDLIFIGKRRMEEERDLAQIRSWWKRR